MKIAFIAISLLLSSLVQQGELQEVVGVPSVTDGDTIRVDAHKIRFHGIDAPESQQTCRNANVDYRCGQQSTNYLISLIGGNEVRCTIVDVDRYKRLVGKCFTISGIDINAAMVSSGNAIAYLYYSQDYKAQQEQAQNAKVGIWAGQFIEPYKWRKGERLNKAVNTSQCEIKGNISSKGVKIFHVQSGQYYSQTKIDVSKGEKWFCTESEAISAGWGKSKR